MYTGLFFCKVLWGLLRFCKGLYNNYNLCVIISYDYKYILVNWLIIPFTKQKCGNNLIIILTYLDLFLFEFLLLPMVDSSVWTFFNIKNCSCSSALNLIFSFHLHWHSPISPRLFLLHQLSILPTCLKISLCIPLCSINWTTHIGVTVVVGSTGDFKTKRKKTCIFF